MHGYDAADVAGRHNWPLQKTSVVLRHEKIQSADGKTKVDRFERVIYLTGGLTDQQRARLLGIADKCPVRPCNILRSRAASAVVRRSSPLGASPAIASRSAIYGEHVSAIVDLGQCQHRASDIDETEVLLSQLQGGAAYNYWGLTMELRILVTEEQADSSPFALFNPTLDAATWAAERSLKALLEYQIESLRFVAKRSHRDLEFMRHLRHCAGLEGIMQLQRNWMSGCIADYAEEFGRMIGTGIGLASSGFALLRGLRPAGAPDTRRAA